MECNLGFLRRQEPISPAIERLPDGSLPLQGPEVSVTLEHKRRPHYGFLPTGPACGRAEDKLRQEPMFRSARCRLFISSPANHTALCTSVRPSNSRAAFGSTKHA